MRSNRCPERDQMTDESGVAVGGDSTLLTAAAVTDQDRGLAVGGLQRLGDTVDHFAAAEQIAAGRGKFDSVAGRTQPTAERIGGGRTGEKARDDDDSPITSGAERHGGSRQLRQLEAGSSFVPERAPEGRPQR